MPTAEEMLKKFNDTKTLPHVALRLAQLISNENTRISEFEKMIKMDPTLVVRLLRVVNSPYYGLRRKVDSISRAVVVIGMKSLRNIVVTTGIKEVFAKGPHEEIFSRAQLWLHCAAVGICSQMISERIFGRAGDDAYLCGILHDIGIIVEDQVAQDLFVQVCQNYTPNAKPFVKYEKETIGTDHCEIGYLLALQWNLPADVQDGIKDHHKTEGEILPSSLTGIVQTADYIVSRLNYKAIPEMQLNLSKDLGIYIRDNMEEFKAMTKDLPDELLKAKELYESEKG